MTVSTDSQPASDQKPRAPHIESISLPRGILYTGIMVILLYAAVALGELILILMGVADPRVNLWVFENSGRTVQFDAVRGFTLTPTPSRYARITKGRLEYLGVLKGNKQGFPDRDDFHKIRKEPGLKRLAVFGDSFTSAQFLEQNWPDLVERLSAKSPQPLELLNFSVDGGGLANWWSILLRLVKPEDYDCDGVLFAVFPADLHRHFSIAEHRGFEQVMFCRVPSWHPDSYPATREEAEPLLKPLGGYIVSSQRFDLAIRGEWYPVAQVRPFLTYQPYLLGRYALLWLGHHLLGNQTIPPSGDLRSKLFEPGQQKLIQDMQVFLEGRGLPVMVVHIPSKPSLLSSALEPYPPAETRKFAELLGARLVDGSRAFEGLNQEEIQRAWFPFDHHWTQHGSDQFGRFMLRVLETWP